MSNINQRRLRVKVFWNEQTLDEAPMAYKLLGDFLSERRIHLKSDGHMLYIAFFDCGERGFTSREIRILLSLLQS